MNDNRMLLQQIALVLTMWVVSVSNLNGQTYKIGDLYTFDDGSKGIVFYVNPDNPGSGTVAALNDLDGQYALWTGSMPQTLSDVFVPNGGFFFNNIMGWESHGKKFTQKLRESGVSPAANAMDVAAGWYIPDILQLQKLYASSSFLKDAFENNDGDIMLIGEKAYWTATRENVSSNRVYTIQYDFNLDRNYGTQSYYIRPVRDFPDTVRVQAFWVENYPHSDTVVVPDTTHSYAAQVVYRSDTLPVTATVSVHQPVMDTLFETVYNATIPYTSIVEPLFSNLDISLPGEYEYRDTLAAANGCDSVLLLKLTVTDNVLYTDTLCPLKTNFYFAPFDTVFAVGTVSGFYEHHGVKLVDGVPVDTVAYYELTVLPEYRLFDTVKQCLYEEAETWRYDGNAHVSIAVIGMAVTVTSDTGTVVVEEVAAGSDYRLKMQAVTGCDSVTYLHLDLHRVSRDTVYKDMLITQLVGGEAAVACHTFTGITESGIYAATDTLTSTDGCDSLVTVFLKVEPLHTETLCDSVLSSDLTWTASLAGYTWNGLPLPDGVGESGYYEFPGQKAVGGGLMDTVSYLQLIVNQKYEGEDTVSFCLYEPTYTTSYVLNSAVAIAVDGGGVITVTSSDPGVEVLAVPGSGTDFALKMQTVSGCDSVVFLHVDVRRVSRDTVRHYAYMHQVESERITVDGHEFTGVTDAGTYEQRDTLAAANGCDSVVVLMLTVGDNVRYTDTLCPLKTNFYFAPFDTVFAVGTVSGFYEHHGVKLVDGVPVDTVAYYELTVLPEYRLFDTVKQCLYEEAETWRYDGNAHVSIAVIGMAVTVTSDTGTVVVEEVAAGSDYRLKMQAVTGCDSVTYLHLDLHRVSRDTVYKDMLITQLVGGEAAVACHTFTGITESGIYAATDTLTSTDGCDSLVTVFLKVEPLHTETLCDSVLSSDLTWTASLAGYTWNGLPLPDGVGESGYYEFPGQKAVGGGLMDTVSYLQLIVNQKYEGEDTVSFCLYEPTYTTSYVLNSAVAIAVDGGGVITVTSSDPGVEVLAVPGSGTDFALKMQTVSGCDSVVFLHVDVRRVSRDTVRHYAYMHQVESERITVDGHEFTGVTDAGTYEQRDTLAAANGCDSVVVHELTVEACASGFTILCPPDIYDTLAYGDCAMTIYPDRIGTATVQYDVAWPFAIGNNIPSDNLFAQGDNVITWTATDLVCGGTVSCEQHVFIAFPQCPDAVDFEGNVYPGVRVGCDCWTQRNLESKRYSDGTDIPGRYAYANAQYPDTAANVAVFGRLYSYEAAVYDSADNGHGHVQGICPTGWYLPTPEKYEGLNVYGADALRSPDYWIIGAGNNSTGFTALPAGFYNGELDRYEGLLTETYFWSTKSVFQANPKCSYSITYYCDFVMEMHSHSGLGYSVRCIKEK